MKKYIIMVIICVCPNILLGQECNCDTIKEVVLSPIDFGNSQYHNIALKYILKNDRNLKSKKINVSQYIQLGSYSQFESVLTPDHFCIINKRKKFNTPCYLPKGKFVNISQKNICKKNNFTLFFSPVFLEKELFVTYSLCSQPCDLKQIPCVSQKNNCFDWVTYYFVFENNQIKDVYKIYPNRNQDDDFHNYIYDDINGNKYDMYGNVWNMYGVQIKTK